MSWKTAGDERDRAAALRPGRPGWSLAARLTAWYAASAFALVLIVSGFFYFSLANYLEAEDDEFLSAKAQAIAQVLQATGPASQEMRREAQLDWAEHEYERVYVRVLDEAARTVVATPGIDERLAAGAFESPPQGGGIPQRGFNVRSISNEPFRAMSASAIARTADPSDRAADSSGPARWTIQVAMSELSEFELLARYRRLMWIVLAIAFVGCLSIACIIARHGIRPVREIAATAQRIRSTTLHERIAPARLPAEIAVLAATFNEMLDRLQDAFARLAAFSSDIAHELRTPINALRGEVEVALSRPRAAQEYRQALESCLEEASRVSRLIDSLLFLARAESPRKQIETELLDVASELAQILEFYEPAAEQAQVQMRARTDGSGSGSLSADLDRPLFQRAIGNLVENALRHTPPGGAITLSARATDGTIEIEVADTGKGIPLAHQKHIFDRFRRVEEDRGRGSGGVGLGLSITRSIAELHGGRVSLSSAEGAGTRITLALPASPSKMNKL